MKYHVKPDNLSVDTGTRAALLNEQEWKCPLCGGLPTDPHHTFLKQSDAPPARRAELFFLFNSLHNLVMLCRECHDQRGQTAEVEIELAKYKIGLGHDMRDYFLLVESYFPGWNSSAWDKSKREIIFQ